MRTSFCSSVRPVAQQPSRTTSVFLTPTILAEQLLSNRREEVEEAMLHLEAEACHLPGDAVLLCRAVPTLHQHHKSALHLRLVTTPMHPSIRTHSLVPALEQARPAAEADVNCGNPTSRRGMGVAFSDGLIYPQLTMVHQRSYQRSSPRTDH